MFGAEHTIGPNGFFVLLQDDTVPVAAGANSAIDPDTEPGENPDLFNTANVLELRYFGDKADALAYSAGGVGSACPVGPLPEGPCAEAPRSNDFDPPISMGRDQFSTDTDNNKSDFSLSTPSPGRVNGPAASPL
ncbi:MAG: hypothetical protein MUF34_33960 [Polyangiaceae bacterium]|nr:hypothetical protein [Polyangiaceae bacterium]